MAPLTISRERKLLLEQLARNWEAYLAYMDKRYCDESRDLLLKLREVKR